MAHQSRRVHGLTTAGAERPWLTLTEAAAELGFGPATVVKLAAQLGGYRGGRAWRFDAATVRAYRGSGAALVKPTQTFQNLAKAFTDFVQVSKERELTLHFRLEKLERRIAALEVLADGHDSISRAA